MPGCADYTVSILHVVHLLGRNGMRLVFSTIQGLGVLLKTGQFFILYPIIPLSLLGPLGQSLGIFSKTSAYRFLLGAQSKKQAFL